MLENWIYSPLSCALCSISQYFIELLAVVLSVFFVVTVFNCETVVLKSLLLITVIRYKMKHIFNILLTLTLFNLM